MPHRNHRAEQSSQRTVSCIPPTDHPLISAACSAWPSSCSSSKPPAPGHRFRVATPRGYHAVWDSAKVHQFACVHKGREPVAAARPSRAISCRTRYFAVCAGYKSACAIAFQPLALHAQHISKSAPCSSAAAVAEPPLAPLDDGAAGCSSSNGNTSPPPSRGSIAHSLASHAHPLSVPGEPHTNGTDDRTGKVHRPVYSFAHSQRPICDRGLRRMQKGKLRAGLGW
jgi:hypothetical protein